MYSYDFPYSEPKVQKRSLTLNLSVLCTPKWFQTTFWNFKCYCSHWSFYSFFLYTGKIKVFLKTFISSRSVTPEVALNAVGLFRSSSLLKETDDIKGHTFPVTLWLCIYGLTHLFFLMLKSIENSHILARLNIALSFKSS